MTNYQDIDFSPLNALAEGEVVTHSRVRDIRLPSGKVLVVGLDSAELFGPDDDNGLGSFSPAAIPARSWPWAPRSPASPQRWC